MTLLRTRGRARIGRAKLMPLSLVRSQRNSALFDGLPVTSLHTGCSTMYADARPYVEAIEWVPDDDEHLRWVAGLGMGTKKGEVRPSFAAF